MKADSLAELSDRPEQAGATFPLQTSRQAQTSENNAPPDRLSPVQKIVLPDDLGVTPLYYTAVSTDSTDQAGIRVLTSEGQLTALPQTLISFDTLFNAFFESYWLSSVDLTRIVLRLKFEGQARIAIRRHCRSMRGLEEASLVYTGTLQSEVGHAEISIDAIVGHSLFTPGVLTFSIETKTTFKLLSGEWLINKAGNPVALALVTCTMDYAKMMPNYFRAIERDEALLKCTETIVIVNHNKGSYDPTCHLLFPEVTKRLQVINQNNTGGSGGFCRGILEAVSGSQVSHVALTDDDVMLAPDAIARAMHLLARAHANLIIGGQMLDLKRGTVLSATGEFFEGDKLFPSNPYADWDLRSEDWKKPFLNHHRGDWNGWWLCILPSTLFETIGLPLPLFLKCDDIEFGLRASTAGYRNVTFPGVALWHDPFDLKVSHWDCYFVMRNAMILRALRFAPQRQTTLPFLRALCRQFFGYLLTYRYYQCELILLAIEDFIRGPECLMRDATQHLSKLRSIVNAYPDYDKVDPGSMRKVPAKNNVQGGLIGLAKSLTWNLFASTKEQRHAKEAFDSRFAHWRSFYGFDVVYIDDSAQASSFRHKRSPKLARKQVFRFLVVILSLLARRASTIKAWRSAEPTLRSVGAWREYYERNGIDVVF